MKALTFNTNSWHFLLATKMAGYKAPYVSKYSNGEIYTYGDKADICTYSKYVVSGLLLLTLAGLAVAAIGFIVSHILLGIYFSIMLGMWFFSDIAGGAMIVAGLILLWLGVAKAWSWNYDRKMSTEYRNRPDGFVKHAYKSWKEKYCVQIVFKDEQHDDNARADGHDPRE